MNASLNQIRSRIEGLLCQKERVIVAIDGSCTAGKTTLAEKLAAIYDCNVLHMDDFFLRPEQRTPERFAEPGGNVDYERFREEVLLPLQRGTAFSYRPFDCKTFTFSEPVKVSPKKLTLIEGCYCNHPHFGDPYDLKIFLTVTPKLQRQRILQRPAFLHQRFFAQWIPMEQMYISHFGIREMCDMVLQANE